MGYNERLETVLQPMPALWLHYLLQSLEIAMYPIVQVTVVRNSLLCGYSTWLKSLENSYVSYSKSYSCYKQLCILSLPCGYSTC